MSDCIFCKIVKGEIPSTKIYEDENTLAFLDIYPISEGHTLVITKKHFTDLHDTPVSQLNYVMDATQKVARALKKSMKADGINIGINNGSAAGQIIFHIHMHVIPRYSGDGLKEWHRDPALKAKIDFKQVAEKIRKEF